MRRGNGDGSIYKLSGKRRKPYAVRVTIGWTTEGKQKYKYIGYYSSKTDAKKALAEYLANPEKIQIERQTLESVFNAMLEKSDFTEGTKKQYISGFKKLEPLYRRPINEIKLEDIEDIMEPETPNTQARIKKTLANCYKYAMKYEYVTRNLTEFIEVKTQAAKEKQVFTPEEIKSLWVNMKTVRHGDIPIILLYTGLRISELLGIRTEDVNLKDSTLFIHESKTAAGVRTIPIHETIRPLIEKRYDDKNKYLFMNGGRKLPYSTYMREFWKVSNHTPHEARHTFITELSKVTDDSVSIKKIVGHALTDITDHYTHRTMDELKEIINKLKY